MANKLYPPGAGDVVLELGEQTIVLKPTLQAGLAISRLAGGIRGAIDKVMQLDLDTITSIIRAGVGQKEAKKLGNLDQLIYENGLMDSQGEVLGKVVEYLTNLARGGRPAEDTVGEEGRDEPDPRSPLTRQ